MVPLSVLPEKPPECEACGYGDCPRRGEGLPEEATTLPPLRMVGAALAVFIVPLILAAVGAVVWRDSGKLCQTGMAAAGFLSGIIMVKIGWRVWNGK